MAYTRKQLVTCVSIVYLVIATALAGYASSRTSVLSLPISNVLSGFTTALPVIAGLLLEAGYDLTRSQERRQRLSKGQIQRPPFVIVANTLIFIYSTVVITLLGTHVAPADRLDCGLERRWRDLFRHKNDGAIRTIQDTLSCCGYANSHDQAYPFPDKNHDQHACEKAFGRTIGCHGPWKQEEQRLAGILMAVVGMVFIWQFAIIAIPTQRDTWLHQVLPDRISNFVADEEHGSGRPRRAIDRIPHSDRFRDNVAEEVSDDSDEENTRQSTVDANTRQIRHALPNADQEQNQQTPTAENEWARS